MTTPIRVVRSASLHGYREVAQSVGLDAVAMLRSAGLPLRCLELSEMPLPMEAVVLLLEKSAEISGCEDFALRLAAQRSFTNLGPISLVLKEEATARQALETLCRYLRLLNASLITRLEENADTITIREEMHLPSGTRTRQAMELAVGVMFRILRELLGEAWQPLRVGFAHRPPTDLVPHQAFFGATVTFNLNFNGIACKRGDLETIQPRNGPGLAHVARQYLEQALETQLHHTQETVRQLIAALLPAGRCTSQQVAAHLRIDRRTLHRYLAKESRTFSRLLDEVRLELAQRQIRDTDQPLSVVAGLLGFSTPSAFGYWFRQQMGCSASDWRKKAVPAPVAAQPLIPLLRH